MNLADLRDLDLADLFRLARERDDDPDAWLIWFVISEHGANPATSLD